MITKTAFLSLALFVLSGCLSPSRDEGGMDELNNHKGDSDEFSALIESLSEVPNEETVETLSIQSGAATREEQSLITGRRLMIRQFLDSGAINAGRISSDGGVIRKDEIKNAITVKTGE